MLAIVAGILVARHLKTTDDLFDSRPSPRTESLVASAIQWAERIMRKIDRCFRNRTAYGCRRKSSLNRTRKSSTLWRNPIGISDEAVRGLDLLLNFSAMIPLSSTAFSGSRYSLSCHTRRLFPVRGQDTGLPASNRPWFETVAQSCETSHLSS